MRCVLTIVLIVISAKGYSQKYLSYGMLTESVRQSTKEHELQEENMKNQLAISIIEQENKKELSKIQEAYQNILRRLSTLGLLIDVPFLIAEVSPRIDFIIESQSRVFKKLKDHPQFIPYILQSEYEFTTKARSLLNYLIGLTLSGVNIIGLKQGDRSILLSHIEQEVKLLSSWSYKMETIINHKIWESSFKKHNFENWISREKNIIREIKRNAIELFK